MTRLKKLIFVSLGFTASQLAYAEKPSHTAPAASSDKAQKIDVEKLRSQYWATGQGDEMAVIQNRQYSKAGRFELGVFGGMTSGDPFLSVLPVGGRVGYYFSEKFAVEAIGWKAFSSNSGAFESASQNQATNITLNPVSGFVGGGIDYCPIYGKLSFVGNSILHFDLGLRAGAGLMFTSTGNYIAPYIGIGQRLYLTRSLSLSFDYKLMYYSEQIAQSVAPGNPVTYGTRSNWSNTVLIGLGFLF